jgi:hypothetical protein
MDGVFASMDGGPNDILSKFTSDIGIFSVCEIPTNKQLWALYASRGQGYVVEFSAQHSFFRTVRDDGADVNLLRKVRYTNDRISDFWHNPYFLFLVKDQEWAFEREWRLIRSLKKCTSTGIHDGEEVFVQDVIPGMITRIIFGYRYETSGLRDDFATIKAFDPNITAMQTIVNDQSGGLILEQIF